MFNALSSANRFPSLMRKSILLQSVRFVNEVTFETKPFKLHRLDSGPSTNVTLKKSDALVMYRQMQAIRRMEQAADLLYKERKIRGFCHLYAGQEACAVGVHAGKEPDDAIITAYRCHGFAYLAGLTVKEVISELLGRSHGCVHGKGGSMHMYGKNFYGGNGIVGAQQPIGAGIAFALKYKKKPNICFTLYGDGAANQGQLAEVENKGGIYLKRGIQFTEIVSAANMCALWKLPCVFICENNGYGLGTPAKRSSASTNYYARGDYIPGIWVDGMDVLAVREATKFARNYSSSGKGPLFVEFATYRFYGHSVADPGTSYRTREEVQEVRKSSDPIARFKNEVLSSNLITKDELKAIDKEVKNEIDEAVNFSRDDEVISNDALISDLYHNTPPVFVRGHTMDDIKLQPYVRTVDMLQKM
ncbi:unnamed protein product [Thelazia callipaeda]|uniref:Pyruvate dehydrogenase E1 component subunit alpha n=1 Tax=Thelazia callipaeda TaxID=103827 RepID=A0A0N5CJZ8_THECL|nr:unnamed protein product [Thelazia callipaeda]